MENEALITLLDSTPASTAAYQADLPRWRNHHLTDVTSTAPTESWPFSDDGYSRWRSSYFGQDHRT